MPMVLVVLGALLVVIGVEMVHGVRRRRARDAARRLVVERQG